MSIDIDFTIVVNGPNADLTKLQQLIQPAIERDAESVYGPYTLLPHQVFPEIDGHEWIGLSEQRDNWRHGLGEQCFLFSSQAIGEVHEGITRIARCSVERIGELSIQQLFVPETLSVHERNALKMARGFALHWFSVHHLDRLILEGACTNGMPVPIVVALSTRFPDLDCEVYGTIEHEEYEAWHVKGGVAKMTEYRHEDLAAGEVITWIKEGAALVQNRQTTVAAEVASSALADSAGVIGTKGGAQ